MSEDFRRQRMRTQGKYDAKNKSCDKRTKISPSFSDPPGKRENRSSLEGSERNRSFTDESVPQVKYEEKSNHSFEQLMEPRRDIEIIDAGFHVLSNTENGESKIFYEPNFLDLNTADCYFERLYDGIEWSSKNIVIRGEEYPQPRLIAWFGPYSYTYSGATLEPGEMPDAVVEIKTKIEDLLRRKGIEVEFNAVLLNLYRNNKDSVSWHSDDESLMGVRPTIASVSLGETRKFEMKPRYRFPNAESPDKEQHFYVRLQHGSLIVMDGCMQDDWLHRVPKEYHDKEARINLTFRTVYLNDNAERVFARGQRRNPIENENSNQGNKINFEDHSFSSLIDEESSDLSNMNECDSSLSSSRINESLESRDAEGAEENLVEMKNESLSHSAKDSIDPIQLPNQHSSSTGKQLNIDAKEFVPTVDANPEIFVDHSEWTLEELGNAYKVIYDMTNETFANFTRYLRMRALQKINECTTAIRDEILFLASLTDGTQTERNQRLITQRMLQFVKQHLRSQEASPDDQKSYRPDVPSEAARRREREEEGLRRSLRYNLNSDRHRRHEPLPKYRNQPRFSRENDDDSWNPPHRNANASRGQKSRNSNGYRGENSFDRRQDFSGRRVSSEK